MSQYWNELLEILATNKPTIMLVLGLFAGLYVALTVVFPAIRSGIYKGATFSVRREEKPIKFWLLILFAFALPAIILVGLLAIVTRPA